MTAWILVIAALQPWQGAQGGQAAQDQGQASPAQIVSQMISKYSQAKSLTGKIVLTQTALNQSGQVTTDVQFELPSKLYIRQRKSTGPDTAIVTSDGKRFTYLAPRRPGEVEGTRVIEAVQFQGKILTVRDIYSASVLSLFDRNAPLDIAIGRREDLEFLRHQWASLEYKGTTKRGNETVHVVMGSWREYGAVPVTGQFRLMVTQDFELREYTVSETVQPNGAQRPTNVLSTWTVDLQIDAKPDPNLFQVVK